MGTTNYLTYHLTYRLAVPADAAACVALRGQTRENAVSAARLAELGITAESWGADILSGALPGWRCESESDDEEPSEAPKARKLLGYCFGDTRTGEIVVLALLPEAEGRGIGKTLLGHVVSLLHARGFRRLFLGTASSAAVRSHGFYRHLGWRPTGETDARGDEVLELLL
jgi:ribosomal protein S18 acetylase RimI-like enzyme